MYTKTILLGRLTKDPIERAYGNDNGKMALFTVATDITKDKTAFNDCIAFGRNAENILKYFKKGQTILVEGTYQNNDTEREVNGQKIKQYGMNMVVDRWSFAGGPSEDAGQTAPQAQPQQRQQTQSAPVDPFAAGFTGFVDDNVPF